MLGKAALSGGALLLALLVAEIGLRVPDWYEYWTVTRPILLEEGQFAVVPADEPGLIYTLRPNFEGTNAQGYLDDEHAIAKPEGVFRIVVIGDSVATGQEGQRVDSFVETLERMLDETSAGRPVEIIMLARSGYATSQQLVLLRTEAFTYDPDLILWSYCLNDPAHPLFHEASGELTGVYRPRVYLAHLAAKAWFQLSERRAARDAPREFHARLHHIYGDQVAADFETIAALCKEKGVAVVMAVHPIIRPAEDFGKKYALRPLHERLVRLADRSGMVALDLLDAYRDHTAVELGLPRDAWHPNAEGHRVAAEFLYRQLIDRELVPPAVPDKSP